MAMLRRAVVLSAVALGVAVVIPACAFAQQGSPPGSDGGTMEIRRSGPTVVAPPPPSPEELERAVKDLERKQRDAELLRQTTPAPSRRPDLDYDVKSGIQQKAIEEKLPSR